MAKRQAGYTQRELSEIREACELDLWTFATVVNPMRLYGDIHREVFKWLQQDGTDSYQLLMLPRGHMKSHCMATWVAWHVTCNPETTILYISATAELAEKQLYDIKNILTSDIYSMLWPEMLDPEEGKREKWASTKIAVDHPKRRSEGVRDWTVATAGLTTNTAGWHAEVIVADDVVVPENAYTEDGRRKTSNAMSQMSSILNAGGTIKACGTRYHPKDQYDTWLKQTELVYDDETDEMVDELKIWDVFERVVEKNGRFLWPAGVRDDGKSFGFNRRILNRIRGSYTDTTQFYAQYYNDPNDPESARVNRDKFQYYETSHIVMKDWSWHFKNKKLNVYASIDFAFSLKKKADYTAIVVIGIDAERNIYVLDIDRFKTDKTSVFFKRVQDLHAKWGFKKLRAETNAAQKIIVNDLKQHFKEQGLAISIDEINQSRHGGTKEERTDAVLQHRYDNQAIWHYKGGHTPALEEEVVLARPPHDDIKDALSSAIEIAVPPTKRRHDYESSTVIKAHNRFGGRPQ